MAEAIAFSATSAYPQEPIDVLLTGLTEDVEYELALSSASDIDSGAIHRVTVVGDVAGEATYSYTPRGRGQVYAAVYLAPAAALATAEFPVV